MRPCFAFARRNTRAMIKTISDWTIRIWRERIPKNGTLPMIGQYKERNLVRCQQPLLLDGALRNSSKNGCEGDYKIPRVQMKGEMFLQFLVTENLTISHNMIITWFVVFPLQLLNVTVQSCDDHRAEWLLFSRHLLTVQEKFKICHISCYS